MPQFKRFSFVAATVTGAQEVTGVGFQADAIIPLSALRLAADGTVVAGGYSMLGISADDAVGPDAAIAGGTLDALASSNTGTVGAQAGIVLPAVAGNPEVVDAQGVISDYNPDGFRVTWGTGSAAPDSAWIIDCLAIGGVDAAIRQLTLDGTTTPISVTGLPFQPKAAIVLRAATGTNLLHNVGMASGPAAQSAMAFRESDNVITMSAQHSRNEARFLESISSTPNVNQALILDSFNADGATFSRPVMAASTQFYVLFLGGADLEADVRVIDSLAADGSDPITGLGFQPEALFGVSQGWAGTTPLLSNTVDLMMAHGIAADGSGQAATTMTAEDGVADSNTFRSHSQAAFIRMLDPAAGTEFAVGSVASYDPDGYTLAWDITGTPGARRLMVLALGTTPAAGPTYIDLAGDLAGTGGPAGELSDVRDLAGAVVGGSTPAGDLARVRDLAGSLAGSSAPAGALAAVVTLGGANAGLSTLGGSLTVGAPVTYVDLAGDLAGAAGLAGDLARVRTLAGSLAGAGTPAGDAVLVRTLAGTVAGTGGPGAELAAIRTLAGDLAGAGTLDAALAVIYSNLSPGHREGVGPGRAGVHPAGHRASVSPGRRDL